MATIERMEKKRSSQIMEILEAVKMLGAEVAELKIRIGEPDVIELKAEIDGTVDRTDEILAAIRSTALDIGQQTRQASVAVGSMADEMVNLKTEIAELRPPIAPPPAAATRRTKK